MPRLHQALLLLPPSCCTVHRLLFMESNPANKGPSIMPSLQLSYCCSLPAMMRVLVVLALGVVAPFCVDAFSTTSTIACPRISFAWTTTLRRSIVLTAKDTNNSEGTTYAPLSRDEIQSLLDTVPVYAVTDAKNQNDVVLLQERTGNDDTQNIDEQPSIQVANFFLTPETANNIYAPFRNQPGLESFAQWDIVQYPLGVVWFELLHHNPQHPSSSSEVVYRLVPNEFELVSARNAVQKQQQQQQQCLFRADYNEIPVFYNPLVRVPEDPTQEKVAFFLGYQDFLNAQQLADAGSRGGGVSVVALKDLVDQMMVSSSEIDFRRALLIPPSSYLPGRPSSSAEERRKAFASASTPGSGADQWTD